MKEKKVFFVLSKAEVDLLKSVLFLEPGLQDVVGRLSAHNNEFIASFSNDEITEALDALAYAAGGMPGIGFKEEKCIDLYKKIKNGLIRSKRAADGA